LGKVLDSINDDSKQSTKNNPKEVNNQYKALQSGDVLWYSYDTIRYDRRV